MHARQIGPLNLGAKPYVRQKSQIIFVGAVYRVLLAATDSNQRPVNGPSRSLAAAASHTRRLGSERVSAVPGWPGGEEPTGKTCGLPRFDIMHRPHLLRGEGRGARKSYHRSKAKASADQYRLVSRKKEALLSHATNT